MTMIVDKPIRVAALSACSEQVGEWAIELTRRLLSPGDEVAAVRADELSGFGADLAVVWDACGTTPISARLAELRIPTIALKPSFGYHPYDAALYRAIEGGGGIVLPADDPEESADSVRAVRAARTMQGTKLIVADTGDSEARKEEIRIFSEGCRKSLGVEIVVRTTEELRLCAAEYSDEDADAVLNRWYAEVLEGPGEMDQTHMRQVAKLYMAEKAMLEEHGAVGITPNDIGGFLTRPEGHIMPNVSYGPLVFEGYLAAEEADIEVLTTELLLTVGLGTHPTMSNIYYAYRDAFSTLQDSKQYTPEMELADCRQCMADNRLTAAHFSASGVLPPGMMEEPRYKVREALTDWPGQSMIVSTPKLGPMVMARLSGDASALHAVSCEADGFGPGDQYGWYRGRWFLKVPSAKDFAARCLHQHYAIGPIRSGQRVLDLLTTRILGLRRW